MCPAHTLASLDEMKKIEVKCEMKCKRLKMNQEAFFTQSNKVLSKLKYSREGFFFSSAWFPGELIWKACNTSDGLHGVEWVGERGGINLLLFICIYLYPYTWSLWSSQYHRQIPRPSRRFRDCWIAQGEEAGLWLSQIDSCRIQSD